MRILNWLAGAALGLVVLMILVARLQPGLILAEEVPFVRNRVVLVSLPMVAYLIALQALRLRSRPISASNEVARSTLSQPDPLSPAADGVGVSEADPQTRDAADQATPRRPEGARLAAIVSVLLGVPVEVLAARFAVSFFAPGLANSLFVPWKWETQSTVGWAVWYLVMPLGCLLAHLLILRDVSRRKSAETAVLTAILLTPMISFAICYQACWLWIRLYGE